MSEQPIIDASQALIELIFSALKNAIDTVREVQPFSPLVLTVAADGTQTPVLIAAETSEQAVMHAHDFISKLGPDITMFALAIDIYITIDGHKYEAILVEAGERGKPFGLKFAQRYHPATADAEFETIGNPAYIGQTDQWLTG